MAKEPFEERVRKMTFQQMKAFLEIASILILICVVAAAYCAYLLAGIGGAIVIFGFFIVIAIWLLPYVAVGLIKMSDEEKGKPKD